jgi:hypothetical protein
MGDAHASNSFAQQVPRPTPSSSPRLHNPYKQTRKTVTVRRSGSMSGSNSKWPRAEDEQLRSLVGTLGTEDWHEISEQMHTHRTPEELESRWGKIYNRTTGPWTKVEDAQMIGKLLVLSRAGKCMGSLRQRLTVSFSVFFLFFFFPFFRGLFPWSFAASSFFRIDSKHGWDRQNQMVHRGRFVAGTGWKTVPGTMVQSFGPVGEKRRMDPGGG